MTCDDCGLETGSGATTHPTDAACMEALIAQRDRYKTALEAFALGAHFHQAVTGPFDPKTCPGCVSENLLKETHP